MSESIKKPKLLMLVISLSIILSFLLYNISKDKDRRLQEYLKSKNDNIQIQYNTIYQNFKIASNNIYLSFIDDKTIIGLLKNIKGSNSSKVDEIRKTIYNMLKKRYERMKLFGVWQLHFHLPNNDSFLRMHKPDKFGDNLTDIRYSVEYVNKNKKSINGFEVGRHVHGFRFVYPLLDENKEHLGSVEISMSSQIFKTVMEKSYKSYIDFIVNKNIINKKLWDYELDSHYQQSNLNKDYLHSISANDKMINITSDSYEQIEKGIKTNNIFSIFNINKNEEHIITFLPVFNTNDKKSAYLVSFHKNTTYSSIMRDYYILVSIITFTSLLILLFIIRNRQFQNILHKKIDDKTVQLKMKNKQIVKKLEEQTHILNTLNEGVIIYINGKCTNFNKKLPQMLGYEDDTRIKKLPFLKFIDMESLSEFPKNCIDDDTVVREAVALTNKGVRFPVLLKYHTHYVDDKPENVLEVQEAGVRNSVLLTLPHNKQCDIPNLTRARNWDDLMDQWGFAQEIPSRPRI